MLLLSSLLSLGEGVLEWSVLRQDSSSVTRHVLTWFICINICLLSSAALLLEMSGLGDPISSLAVSNMMSPSSTLAGLDCMDDGVNKVRICVKNSG